MTYVELDVRAIDPDIADLCRAYWEMDSEGSFVHKVADLATEYDVRKHLVASTVREHSTARSTSQECARCGRGVVLTSRADLQSGRGLRAGYCADCWESAETERRQQAEAQQSRQVEILQERFGAELNQAATDFGAYLGLRDAVILLALIRCGGSEGMDYIRPRSNWPIRLTPQGGDADVDALRDLTERRMLYVSAASAVSAFEWTGDDPASYYLSHVAWLVGLEGKAVELGHLATELEARLRSDRWPIRWELERAEVWQEVALAEVLAYLGVCLWEHDLPFKPGDKTRLVLTTALEHYAIGQVMNWCWRAAKDAAAFYVRERVSKPHAANLVVGSIQRMSERAQSEGWDVTTFRRDRRCPLSAVSEVLAFVAFGSGDEFLATPVGPESTRVDARRLVLDDAAALLGFDPEELAMHAESLDLGFAELERSVRALNETIERGAEAWTAAYPVGADGQPAKQPVERALPLVAHANADVDDADAALRTMLELPSKEPPADPLAPRSLSYTIAQLEDAGEQLESNRKAAVAAAQRKKQQRKKSRAARKRSKRR